MVPQEQTPPVAFNFPFGKSVLQIDSPALVARLESTVPTNGGAVTYRLRDGVVGGFVSAHNMLAQVAEFTVVDGGCDLGNGLFTFARANLCGLQDVALTPDGGACNGFSAGVGFEADPAEFGMLRDPDLFDSGCSADLLKCP